MITVIYNKHDTRLASLTTVYNSDSSMNANPLTKTRIRTTETRPHIMTVLVQCELALPFLDTAISKFDHQNLWRPCMWSKVKVIFYFENSKVKVMAKVKPSGHIWGLELNRYVCFSFPGNRTTLGWDIANSTFDLENSRSRSWPKSNLMVTFEA